MTRTLSILLMLFSSVSVAADCGPDADICAGDSAWVRVDKATVRIQQDKQPDFAQWNLTFAGNNDLMVSVDSLQGGEKSRGTILMVSGRAMLTRDLPLERGYEIDALDAPVLMFQLVAALLSQAVPEGPAKLSASREINVTESKRFIRTATQSASGRFPPPWAVIGSITVNGPLSFAYSLKFTFPTEEGGGQSSMILTGLWSKDATAPVLKDDTNIEGWSLHTIGPYSIERDGGTIFDYGAQPTALQARTLGELRKNLDKSKPSK